MRIVSVVGTRPNFMKIAPIAADLGRRGIDHVLVHTGQHYDDAMSQIFFDELGIAAPNWALEVGTGSPTMQTARVLERLEPVLERERPDVLVVPGDVTSTLAAALVAAKLEIPIAHVEAGLRSHDRSMPEELNRVLTDQLAEMLFTHSPEARGNLLREGVVPERIFDVGNTMIDTLVAMEPRIAACDTARRLGLQPGAYLVVTLHRPALVDGPLLFTAIKELQAIAGQMPVIFPAHPRTRARLGELATTGSQTGLRMLDPLGYLDFMSLVRTARGVLTDSGGIQEETTYLGIPCCTLRASTERPVTTTLGTNVLLGLDPARIAEVPAIVERVRLEAHEIPPGWDGHAASRISEVLLCPR